MRNRRAHPRSALTIGLIGYGRFGALAARHLSKYAPVLVYDRRTRRVPRTRRIRPANLDLVAAQPVVILAVPISALRESLRAIRQMVTPGALVIDVCTVKAVPVRWMREMLPRSVRILGSHPFFGPDSAQHSLRGHRIVLTPVRIPARMLRTVTSLLQREGLVVVRMTPDRHDRMVAETILLTHYLGRLVHLAGLHRWDHGTRSYANLLGVVDVAMNDTLQLLRDVWSYNAHTASLARSLRRAERKLSRLLRR